MNKKIRVATYVALSSILILSCSQKEDTNKKLNSSTSETENEVEFSLSEKSLNKASISEEPSKEEVETNTIEERYGLDVFITGNSYEEEYKNSIEWLQNRILTREPETEIEHEKYFRQQRIDNYTDTLEIYTKFVDSLCKNESMDSEDREKTYQKAMAFLLASCKMHRGYAYENDSIPNALVYFNNPIGNYSFSYGQESTNRMITEIINIQFKEYPIDTGCYDLKEIRKAYSTFSNYDLIIFGFIAEGWEKEFYHCIQVTEKYMSDNNRPNEAANLRAFEKYVLEWADKGEEYVSIGLTGSGLSYDIYASRKEAFRTGTVVLLMFCEQEGITYEYLYDYEKEEKRFREFLNRDLIS